MSDCILNGGSDKEFYASKGVVMACRMMSFDGGGVRGVYTAQLLSMLQQEVDFLKKVDVFVGTSTGSFIALGLSLGYTPDQLVGLYQQFAPLIFSMNQKLTHGESVSEYSSQHLKQALEQHVFVGSPTLADLPQHVIIPVFKLYDTKLQRWQPTCFHNFDRVRAQEHPVADVALAACAAPIFFPSYQGYIDGGVFVNNPSMFGIAQTLKYHPKEYPLKKMKVFSLGTTMQPIGINEEVTWGVKGWMEGSKKLGYPLLSLMTEGVVDIAHEQCEQILGKNYLRINTVAPCAIGIDAAQEIPRLIDLAQRVPEDHPQLWRETLTWLKSHF